MTYALSPQHRPKTPGSMAAGVRVPPAAAARERPAASTLSHQHAGTAHAGKGYGRAHDVCVLGVVVVVGGGGGGGGGQKCLCMPQLCRIGQSVHATFCAHGLSSSNIYVQDIFPVNSTFSNRK
eukprot:scaffold46527_cov22-Tisochrysis_lutea.AAC.1